MNETTAGMGASGDKGRRFTMQKVYLKDLSFESPNSPDVFTTAAEPQLSMNVQITSKDRTNDQYEIVLSVTITATTDIGTVFLIEVDQGAIFLIQGYSEAERKSMISSICPSSMFPFTREAIWSIIGKGGFPPLLIRPVDFDAMVSGLSNDMELVGNRPSEH